MPASPPRRKVARQFLCVTAVVSALSSQSCIRLSTDSLPEDVCAALPSPGENGPTLSVGLEGCLHLDLALDKRTLICALDPLDGLPQPVRVIVRNAAEANLTIIGDVGSAESCSDRDGGTLATPLDRRCREFQPQFSPGSVRNAKLRLCSRAQVLGERNLRIISPQRTSLDDLRQQWRKAAAQGVSAVRALIPRAQELVDAQPQEDLRAQAQILSTRIQYDCLLQDKQSGLPPAEADIIRLIDLFERALQTSRIHGWLKEEAEASQALAWLYANSSSQADPIQSIENLLVNREWLQLLPANKIQSYVWFVQPALARQDLRRVQRYVADAMADAELLNDMDTSVAAIELRTQELEAIALTGSHEDVAAGLRALETELARAAGRPCVQAYLWGSIGWLRLLSVELGWLDVKAPIATLEQARALRSRYCPRERPQRLANVWANLARAQSAAWWRRAELTASERIAAAEATRSAIVGMRNALGSQQEPDSIRLDHLLSEVRIALFEEQPAQALKHFDELSRLAQKSRSPLERWLVLVHKGEAMEALGQIDEALAAFRTAESQLLELRRLVPIYQSHRLVLSRFEYSSQRAVSLALRKGRAGEVVDIIRQAAQSRLGLTSNPWWREQQTSSKLEAWQKQLKERKRYLLLRQSYESQIPRVAALTPSACQELVLTRSRVLDALDALFSEPTPSLAHPAPLPSGELLMGCMRQDAGWICFGQSSGAPKLVRIARPDLDQKAVEDILLPALAAKIRHAARLSVLAANDLANVGMASRQFDGHPLGTQKPIYYTLGDLSAVSQPLVRQALVVLDPEEALSSLSVASAAHALESALGSIPVSIRSARKSYQISSNWVQGAALSLDVFSELQRSDLFVYFGHVDGMPCETQTPLCSGGNGGGLEQDKRLTALCLEQHTTLLASDVLVADRAPQRAILLGCSSAGRSATTPTEMVGLAQAFALRGSQVLAFGRPVAAAQVEEVLCALSQYRLADTDLNFGRILVEIQEHFEKGERCQMPGGWHMPSGEHGARYGLRQEAWAELRWYGP